MPDNADTKAVAEDALEGDQIQSATGGKMTADSLRHDSIHKPLSIPHHIHRRLLPFRDVDVFSLILIFFFPCYRSGSDTTLPAGPRDYPGRKPCISRHQRTLDRYLRWDFTRTPT